MDSHLSLECRLELALSLLPRLAYQFELGMGSQVKLHALRDALRARWRY